MKKLLLFLLLTCGMVSAQTATISGTTYHGVSGDNFITIASAWNEGDITDAWDWNWFNWLHNGNPVADMYDLSTSIGSIGSGQFFHIRIDGFDHPVVYSTRDIGASSEYFVIPSLGRNGLGTGEGEEIYNSATASGTVYNSPSEARREAHRLADANSSSFQVWERASGGFDRYVAINNRNYRLYTSIDIQGSFSHSYDAAFIRNNPFNLLIANNWTTGTFTDPIDGSTLHLAIHPSGNYAVISIPGGAYNSYHYANGALGKPIERHNSPEEVRDYNFGG